MKESACTLYNSSFAILVMALVLFASCDTKDMPIVGRDGTDLNSFSLSDGNNTYKAFHINDSTVYISVPNHSNLTKLTACFEHNGNEVTVDGVKQISGKSINDYSDFVHPVKFNVVSLDGKIKEYAIRLFDLPVVYITTEGKAPIYNKIDWVPAKIKMISTDGTVMLDKEVSIRGRGNATWESYPKKAYSLKFDEKTSLLDYPKSKRWVLLGTSADWTKLRTPLCFKISELLGTEWTPRGQNIELVLNDTLLCNFFLCEQVRVEKNRINIQEMSPADTIGEALTGGVLFEIDRHYDEDFKFKAELSGLPFMLKSPNKEVNEKQMAYFKDYIGLVEKKSLFRRFSFFKYVQ